MPRVSKPDLFLHNLSLALQRRLPADFVITDLPHFPRVVRAFPWGYAGVKAVMSTGYLPATNVSLEFGVHYAGLIPILARIDAVFAHPSLFHVYQTTVNFRIGTFKTQGNKNSGLKMFTGPQMVGVNDYNVCDHDRVIAGLLGETADSLFAYFDRFADPREARLSMETKDGWSFTLGAMQTIAAIDVMLGDMDHLASFGKKLTKRHEIALFKSACTTLGIDVP